ncbi:Inner membrane protein translocase component YidC, long form [Altererythrobacter epoxidivorans]|uniref:Membrane protein insertase YidC n=1 Tax=Altererythrobacter epoxidivorans TaxID=361183 RepID=A0A0M5KYZ7_9SPHN|nr:membrane protein insertase YidC [Altererythrobacter epoxidivorans]ALE15537.1 Inner membrane protein translocase component YidC, long form [Altererythrobacter epoxidivorans]
MDNQRNLLLAVALSFLLILGWDAAMRYVYPEASLMGGPDTEEQAAADGTATVAAPAASGAAIEGDTTAAAGPVDLDKALASEQRVRIDAPRVEGSINLVGARIDDIELKDHRQTVDKDSRPVQLLSPQGTENQQFAQFGWLGQGVSIPGAKTVWQADGDTLTAGKPVTLSWDNGAGQTFRIRFEIDENYMVTATQTVANTGEGPIVVQPYGLITRTSANASPSTWNVHSGPIGGFGDTVEYDPEYDDLAESGTYNPQGGATDWIGFSDIYWLSALVPDNGKDATPGFRSLGNNLFRADLIYAPQTVPAGKQISRTTRLFAGAKESVVLDQYEDAGIQNFGKAVDWGWFEWFVKPMVWLLRQLYDFAGNFGVAIILLTILIRGVMFPIAQKQFASMAAMKAVQPKMKAIQERYKDDKQRQQQEVMKLYKDEGVNPLAGCLPLLIQIPIFFALYKSLILAIEMRHKPFALWIHDLSAPDPAKILNLFGLLPFDPPGFLGIGVLAVLLGITMWLTFRLNPSAMDPVQQQIFQFMPWVLMFVMAPFAAGLLIYWVTSNLLTLAQQSYLYSKHPQLRAAAEKQKADQAMVKARDEQRKD